MNRIRLSNAHPDLLVFDSWRQVPNDLATRQKWELDFRKVGKNESPSALLRIVSTRKLDSVDAEFEVERFIRLYHVSQTKPIRKTRLNVARHLFYRVFVATADRRRLLRWTKGEWKEEDGERYWNEESNNLGWLTFNENFGLQKAIDHTNGKEIYGIFGAEGSYFLLIDLDLHNQPLTLFFRRLAALVDLFHGKHRCHFQVSDTNAGGIHLILVFGTKGHLESRRRWLWRQLAEADSKDAMLNFTKGDEFIPQFNVEIYPDPTQGVRLPLSQGRSMLLDKPLSLVERRGKLRQDVVGYMKWLADPGRSYMSKPQVIASVAERLNVMSAKGAELSSKKLEGEPREVTRNQHVKTGPQKVERVGLKGKTRGALIGYWLHGEPDHFRHLNAAILVTLRALQSEGMSENDAVDLVLAYVEDLPNQEMSSRQADLPAIRRTVTNTARNIWKKQISSKWRAVQARWNQVGFWVSDKTTWMIPSQDYQPVVVDCDEIQFTEEERALIIAELVPLLVGVKQARKQEKQDEVVRAVAYFLRYVWCCDREIAVTYLPEILSTFDIKLKNHDKQHAFFQLLQKWKWIVVEQDYFHPKKHGVAGQPKAKKYQIGPAAIKHFESNTSNKTTEKEMDLYNVSHFLNNRSWPSCLYV